MKLRKNILQRPVMARKVEVVAYDPNWPAEFEKEATNLRKIFKGELIEIHHIGSTSIPGMEAKPIIDLLMAANDIQKIDSFNQKMRRARYVPQGENGIPGRRFFFKGNEYHHTHHLHVFQKGHTDIARHINFRDYLIAHPEEAKKYACVKKELANRYPLDIDSYQLGKEQFIREIDRNVKVLKK
jgi:GrpB-like predicted nucleotidyltransferase (UPF0157 family)